MKKYLEDSPSLYRMSVGSRAGFLGVLAALSHVVLSGCSGEADDAVPAMATDDLRAPARCPGRAPPAGECWQVYCNSADQAWDERPLAQGTRCGTDGQCDGQGTCVFPPPPPPPDQRSDREFAISALGNRCMDFSQRSAGAPVTARACTGSTAQRVRIKEIDGTHDVELRAGSDYCVGVRGGIAGADALLELQTCSGALTQRFAIDGDAILIGKERAAGGAGGIQREFAVKPSGGVTTDGTPLAIGTRDTSDSEHFRFTAVDGSGSKPTTGFVKVQDGPSFLAALNFGWGTVIEVDDRSPIELVPHEAISVPGGVTIRGGRKHTAMGAEIRCASGLPQFLFLVQATDVRITGLRLRGNRDSTPTEVTGIRVAAGENSRVFLDHLDASNWKGSALDFAGDLEVTECTGVAPGHRAIHGHAVNNFVHHNDNYGVVVGTGAFAVARGNVMYENDHHDIAADPRPRTGYAAYDNLMMTPIGDGHSVDMHGSGDPGHWAGGIAGEIFDVGWNTFLGVTQSNLKLRGTPCYLMSYHHNVSRLWSGSAISDMSEDPSKVSYFANQFNVGQPMTDLAVGDFDNDGIDDVFAGTGAAWYFSSAGQTEWHLLNRMPERPSQLRFGDFDNDGRTDVVRVKDGSVQVSWAGGSPWQILNHTDRPLEDVAVGDFDADGSDDLFVSSGADWNVAPGGGAPFRRFAVSNQRANALRFGDFDGDDRTDVLGVAGGQWQIVRGNGESWVPWGPALTSSLTELVVGDFDADGFSDVAAVVSGAWRFSSRAMNPWTVLRSSSAPITELPVGRFDGDARTDVILWNELQFDLSSGGTATPVRWSRQVMR